MEQRVKLNQELNFAKSMKMLTTAYQEHALEQISFARYSVLASREFAQELTGIFFNVKTSYQTLLGSMMQEERKKLQALRQAQKNGKEALVLVSANNKLYGDLIPKICRLFIEKAKASKADLFVIGRQGKNYVDLGELHKEYNYFEIPDTNISLEYLKPLYTKLLPYEKVTVFCGKFNNIASQDPIEADVSGYSPTLESQHENPQKEEKFFFEPSLEHVLNFFENQIFSILLGQIIADAQLARFGSRIKAMENAQNNMQKIIERLLKQQKKLKHMDVNKKQLELFAGRKLWGGKRR